MCVNRHRNPATENLLLLSSNNKKTKKTLYIVTNKRVNLRLYKIRISLIAELAV